MLTPWKSSIVLLLILLVLGSFLSLAISKARTAARRMQSQNNLKQLGLAVSNFESTYRRLPPGSDDREYHGWMSLTMPFVEASAWYQQLDRDLLWEHPLNQQQFKVSIPTFAIPDQQLKHTAEGYAITGYLANPAILHRGSATQVSELTSGLSHVWLAGEIGSGFTPFGYPYNWRELRSLDQSPSGFGHWSHGAYFAFVDGSVKFLEREVDTAVLRQLAGAVPLPDQSLYAIPKRRFSLAKPSLPCSEEFVEPQEFPMKGGPPRSVVWFNSENRAEFIDFRDGAVEVDQIFKLYREAKLLRIPYPKDAADLEQICGLTELEMPCFLQGWQLRDQSPQRLPLEELLTGLKSLTKLRFLKLEVEAVELERLQHALPSCEIIPSKYGP